MGNVGSRPEEPASVFMRDQTRLTVSSLQITNAKKKTLLSITPNAFPSTRAVAKRDIGDDSLIEYVQDPTPNPTGLGLLLKVINDDELNFEFTFVARQRRDDAGATVDTNITGLTFILASNHQELDNLVTREFHNDPNLHKHANVDFLGDYSTGGSPSVSFTWSWKWRPPKGVAEKSSGYRNTCAFVEYDQRAHKLSRLVEFSFWVQNNAGKQPGTPLGLGLGLLDPKSSLPKQRISSNQSTDSNALSVISEPLTEPLTPGLEATFDMLSPSTSQAPKADPNCYKPGDDDIGDDGPLFRATMKEMESRTAILRQRMKKVLRRAEQAKSALSQSNDALSLFIESLREVASNNASGVKPALQDYVERYTKEILRFEKQNEAYLQKLIIDPLTKLYSYDIKAAEAKKKEFDEESREFYAFVSRYLGMKNDSVTQKKKTESDTKYVAKKRNFEIKRHDYSSFMQDLHGGRKEQEMVSHLTKYAEAQANAVQKTAKKVQDLQPQLEALLEEVKNSEKQFRIQRTEREERRRALEMGVPTSEDTDTVAPPSAVSAKPPPSLPIITTESISIQPDRPAGEASTIRSVSTYSGSPPSVNDSTTTIAPSINSTLTPSSIPSPTLTAGASKFKGFRDLEEKDGNGIGVSGSDRRKEGLLWALSRPGGHHDPKSLQKTSWHKYWVVLAGGQLCEYSNWKEKLDLHNDPINLRMASVREARNQERRFCFEVITPQYKRVYQATSEDDMSNWITAINNAVKGMLEGGKSMTTFDASKLVDGPNKKDISQVFGKNAPYYLSSGHTPLNAAAASNSLQRRITVGSRPNYTRRSSTFNDDPEKLLQMVRDADPTNSSCADCGSQVKTEWVSINLGIVLCIECSGIHRSLGTHISKIRSLTLDVTSFTPDLTELLVKIGNKVSNSVWEARLDAKEKLTPTASREARLKFITAKYITRSYVNPISSTLSMYPTADETLAAAVEKNDISLALYALAVKGNPNLTDEKGVHIVYHALAVADPKKEKDVEGESSSTTTQKDSKEPTFPMAELLLQNGASIAAVNGSTTLPISNHAKGYIALKSAKAGGVESSSGAPGSSSGTSSASNGVSASGGGGSGDETKKKEKEDRLRKRVSTSGRIVRAQVFGESR
ncbi:hypothetical protein ABW19_dt0207702 [Dactylella cylindrospora]|nr:hypothetical protein ABW19_dt0207702 [Dactylella cylindrospora]